MRLQIQIIATVLAFSLLVFSIMVLYVNIYSYTTSYNVKGRIGNIYQVIVEKPTWTACGLAERIIESINARLVYVNLTEVNILDGAIIRSEECNITASASSMVTYHDKRVYSVGTPIGTMVIYSVEVMY
ncbi:MAG: hypothetical protein QXP97_06040 [Desulfurococcus sp.]